jgi:hypothetical protein|tara:strand:- start:819 stop:953 length:135 start_codon:yes stop_codon:yes gene_type:complete
MLDEFKTWWDNQTHITQKILLAALKTGLVVGGAVAIGGIIGGFL